MAFQVGFLFFLEHKITLLYLISFVFIRYITRYHSLSLIVIFCYSLSFAVIRCLLLYHSLSLVESLVVIRCTTRCHSLSLVVIRCTTCCHSLYHLLSFVVTRCHSMSLDVPLAYLFTSDHYFISFCFLHHL